MGEERALWNGRYVSGKLGLKMWDQLSSPSLPLLSALKRLSSQGKPGPERQSLCWLDNPTLKDLCNKKINTFVGEKLSCFPFFHQ